MNFPHRVSIFLPINLKLTKNLYTTSFYECQAEVEKTVTVYNLYTVMNSQRHL